MQDDVHQTPEEVSEFEQWQRERDAIRAITGGVVLESTSDDPEQILAAMFQAEDVRGPKLEIGARGIRTSRGGTEHQDPDEAGIEDYRQAVPGRELRADRAAFQRRADEYSETHRDFDAVLSQNIQIPVAAERTLYQLANGPQVADFLGRSPEVARALCDLAQQGQIVEVVRRVREMGRDLERMGMNLDGSYSDFRESRNRQDNIRRRPG